MFVTFALLAVLAAISANAQPAEKPAEGNQAEPVKVDPAEQAAPRVSFLAYCWTASPFFFVMMGALSVYLVYQIVDQFLSLRLTKIIPPKLVATVENHLDEKKYKEAYEALKGDPSLFARSLCAGVERLSHGFDRGVEAMVGVSEESKMDLEHRVGMIALIGQLTPMLGLLGTVLGMVISFQQISRGQPKPSELAESIGLALVSTLEGLILAIPAIFFFGLFRNWIARLILQVEVTGEALLYKFMGAIKKS